MTLNQKHQQGDVKETVGCFLVYVKEVYNAWFSFYPSVYIALCAFSSLLLIVFATVLCLDCIPLGLASHLIHASLHTL